MTETQMIIRDEPYGQYLELDANTTQTGKIVLSREFGGYAVSQTDLANFEKYIDGRHWSPFTSVVKLEPLHPISNTHLEIYEKRNEFRILPEKHILANYLCVCVGSAIAGYLAHCWQDPDCAST